MDPFESYARTRLYAAVFVPVFKREAERLFAASLTSTNTLINALGDYSNTHGAAPPVLAGFVETMTPNAFADRYGEVHIIGMHVALFVTIVDFALYAFTQSDFLPSVGDAMSEDSPSPAFGSVPGLFLLDRTLQGGAIDPATDRHRVPKDADRHVAAIYLAILMARFVWLHEWAHCRLGHVARLHERDEMAQLYEVPEALPLVSFHRSGDADEWRHTQHAMELEADEAALLASLRVQAHDLENVPGIRGFDLLTRTGMAARGALMMAWLFEEYQRHMATLGSTTHPRPRDRLARLQAIASRETGFHSDDLGILLRLRAP